LSNWIPVVSSIRGRRRISDSAKSTEKARPTRANHAHRLDAGRPFGKTMRSRRNRPLGTMNDTTQYASQAAQTEPGSTFWKLRPTIA
jgi:hypothetical protein